MGVPLSKPIGEPFGLTADGTPVELFTLTNSRGLRLRAMTYGAVVVGLETPDRHGVLADIALGYPRLEDYLDDPAFLGAVIGRFGNRIAGGKFSVDGREYQLATNNAPNGIGCALHGGVRGFNRVVWQGHGVTRGHGRGGAQGVRFSYLSKDGEEGYPGNLQVSVTYWLTEEDAWEIEYEATADQATPVNLTQHSYFNLKGEGVGDILAHELELAATQFTPVNAGLIPTGELRAVAGTPMDFSKPRLIGARIDEPDPQLKFAGGYDHNWVLDKPAGVLGLAARVFEPESGRCLEVFTTEPGIQFYSGNFLDGTRTGKAGHCHLFRGGLCLETQHYPDSPNQRQFPDTLLRPGSVFKSTTIYRFGSK